MNVLFEEDGAFRAGVVLADNNTSLQVELPGGKRAKVKAANVLLRFTAPSATELMATASAEADTIDTSFLWEVCGDDEFSFEDLAAEYHGPKPGAVKSAAVLMRLHAAPMYFHRKGKGRYRKAPPEILQAALAGLEKKRLQAEAIERMTAELAAGQLPEECKPLLPQIMYQPDRNRSETKAFEAACAQTGLSPAQLLQRCGAITSTHDYHLGRFLHEYFPEGKGGTGFPAFAPPTASDDLPLATTQAFSIDDAATTEIDDALSIVAKPDGGWTVGIHIAAPGLGIAPDSDLGRIARERLSTVYMPGRKITMLPDAVVEQFTLAAGRTVPALSLYIDVAADYRVLGHATKMERVAIAANLRHHEIEPVFNARTVVDGLPEFPYRDELMRLWEFAVVLEAGRGKAGKTNQRKDYNFSVDWGAVSDIANETGCVTISDRERGSPLDTLVAELMIYANSTWGGMLRDAGIPALYRVQTAGKVRMSTAAAPHEGLGVDCYAWSSSPLRRYCDLVNQWQLLALLRQTPPPFAPKSAELFAAMRDFDATYTAYADFQRGMERYWCLRWLLQEKAEVVEAHVMKEALVRLERIPLVLRVPSLPDLSLAPRGARVRVALGEIDLLAADVHARFLELAPHAASDAEFDEDVEEEAAE